jgi:hypothetical protein
MTPGERVLAAIDETLAEQIRGAADQAWLRVSAGEAIEVSFDKFMKVFGELIALHEKIRAAAEKKFGMPA